MGQSGNVEGISLLRQEEMNAVGEPLRVVLLDTNLPEQKGSMARYGDMVFEALSGFGTKDCLSVERVRLTPPLRLLRFFPSRVRGRISHIWIMLTARMRLRRVRADVFHILDGSYAYVGGRVGNIPVVTTSHDLIPALQAARLLGKRPGRAALWLIRQSLKGLKSSAAIIAVSNNTAVDLGRLAGISPEKIYIVYSAVTSDFTPRDISLTFTKTRFCDGNFILHVGNNAFYKNRQGVVRIFARVLKEYNILLKMAGPAPSPELLDLVAKLGLTKHVAFVVDPSGDDLTALYRRASLFLFPSLYEGFGWPPLEAMASGCPVVCSNTASLPEVVGDAALTCPPSDEAQMAVNCLSILRERALAEDLIQQGFVQAGKFTLKKMGEELFRLYSQVSDSTASRPEVTKDKLLESSEEAIT